LEGDAGSLWRLENVDPSGLEVTREDRLDHAAVGLREERPALQVLVSSGDRRKLADERRDGGVELDDFACSVRPGKQLAVDADRQTAVQARAAADSRGQRRERDRIAGERIAELVEVADRGIDVGAQVERVRVRVDGYAVEEDRVTAVVAGIGEAELQRRKSRARVDLPDPALTALEVATPEHLEVRIPGDRVHGHRIPSGIFGVHRAQVRAG